MQETITKRMRLITIIIHYSSAGTDVDCVTIFSLFVSKLQSKKKNIIYLEIDINMILTTKYVQYQWREYI